MKFEPYILLIGPISDPMVAIVSEKLTRRDCTLVVLDFQQSAHKWPIAISTGRRGRSGIFRFGARKIPLEAIRSTYVRRGGAIVQENDGEYLRRDQPHHQALFPNLLGWLPGLVMNPYRAACSNGSKPYQQLRITQLGFRMPKTLVTTVPQAAHQFYIECQEKVIFKSLSAERSVVKRLTEEDLPRLDQLQCCPVQFQEYIPGIDFRVHVVGSRVFASQIETSSTDYRYVEKNHFRNIRAVELSSELQEKCVALTKGLGLVLAGIDLRRTFDGDYVCFEVNTSPAFMFYESQTGQRIGAAVAELLFQGQCVESGCYHS